MFIISSLDLSKTVKILKKQKNNKKNKKNPSLLEILLTPTDKRLIGLAGEVNHCQVGIGSHAES